MYVLLVCEHGSQRAKMCVSRNIGLEKLLAGLLNDCVSDYVCSCHLCNCLFVTLCRTAIAKIIYLQPHHVRSFVRPSEADDDRDHKKGLVSVEMGSGVANEANPGPEESLTCGTYARRWDVGRR